MGVNGVDRSHGGLSVEWGEVVEHDWGVRSFIHFGANRMVLFGPAPSQGPRRCKYNWVLGLHFGSMKEAAPRGLEAIGVLRVATSRQSVIVVIVIRAVTASRSQAIHSRFQFFYSD